jgi:hypothetical protein
MAKAASKSKAKVEKAPAKGTKKAAPKKTAKKAAADPLNGGNRLRFDPDETDTSKMSSARLMIVFNELVGLAEEHEIEKIEGGAAMRPHKSKTWNDKEFGLQSVCALLDALKSKDVKTEYKW